MSFYCKPHPETVYPNPLSEEFQDLNWRLRYAPDSLTRTDQLLAASTMSAYSTLTTHVCARDMWRRMRRWVRAHQ